MEYRVIHHVETKLEALLNEAAQEGWTLVQVLIEHGHDGPFYTVILTRKQR